MTVYLSFAFVGVAGLPLDIPKLAGLAQTDINI
jgi:hypothetical protein